MATIRIEIGNISRCLHCRIAQFKALEHLVDSIRLCGDDVGDLDGERLYDTNGNTVGRLWVG